jgi:hypothetical protein
VREEPNRTPAVLLAKEGAVLSETPSLREQEATVLSFRRRSA